MRQGNADTRMSSAAPRHGCADAVAAIPIPCAGVDGAEQAIRPELIARVHRRRESVLRVFHEVKSLVVIVYLHDPDHRAERLFVHDTHAMRDVQ